MKKSEINFSIELDDNSVPEKIEWTATDAQIEGPQTSKAVSVATWDEQQKNTLRIDLWTKDMPIHEMKQFYIDCLGGLSQSILNATGDEYMSNEMNALCDKLVHHLEQELNSMK